MENNGTTKQHTPSKSKPPLKLRVVQNANHKWSVDTSNSQGIQTESNSSCELPQSERKDEIASESIDTPTSTPTTVKETSTQSLKRSHPESRPTPRKRGRPSKYTMPEGENEQLANMSINQLRDFLKQRGLSPGKGYKHDLIARVKQAMELDKLTEERETTDEEVNQDFPSALSTGVAPSALQQPISLGRENAFSPAASNDNNEGFGPLETSFTLQSITSPFPNNSQHSPFSKMEGSISHFTNDLLLNDSQMPSIDPGVNIIPPH
jgi:hypothetical protein